MCGLTLCLDWVEEGKAVLVECFKGVFPQGGHREGLQVKQLGRRRELLWENEMSERDWQLRL